MNLRWLPTPIYSFFYRSLMQFAHRHHWHHAPPIYPDGDKVLWCQWCGFQQCVRKAGYKPALSVGPECASGVARQEKKP